MPAPLALSPIAWTVIRIGAVAAVAAIARSRSHPRDPHQDVVLDDLPEGLSAKTHTAEAERAMHGHGRFKRTLRVGPGGPGVEIDASGLGRLRFRRV